MEKLSVVSLTILDNVIFVFTTLGAWPYHGFVPRGPTLAVIAVNDFYVQYFEVDVCGDGGSEPNTLSLEASW